ncbi:MAG: DUF932 domain-containing protein, partial [Kiritimatiellae bacterium]|nr:DUF932 domain-containing protein [Kiritimatiellia bacterium]
CKPGETSGDILPIGGFGPQYTILQNSDLYGMIAKSILPELPGAKVETVGTLEGGATGTVQISCGKDFSIKGDASKSESRLYFNNPVGGGALVMGFCLTRCVCENTIALARKEVLTGARTGTGHIVRHTSAIEVYAKRAIETIKAQALATKTMQERIKALAAKKVNAAQIKKALAEVYPATPKMAEESPAAYANAIARREEVITQWEGGETAQSFTTDSAWKLVNAFTFPIFNPSKITKGSDLSGVRYDAMFGDRAGRVAGILEAVERIAA